MYTFYTLSEIGICLKFGKSEKESFSATIKTNLYTF